MMMELTLDEQNPIDQDRLAQLRTVVGAGPVLILTHDNPDPDGLASGKALATLFKLAWGIPSRLVYSGLVARAENRAMLSHLTPEWEHTDILTDLERYSALVLADAQPGAGNSSLPENYVPHIVIDHHQPVRAALRAVPYTDVRPEIGATVSLAYQHLEAAGIEPDATLATAMFYGLQVDTRGLSRGASPTDETVYVKLLDGLDRGKLIQVEQAGLPQDYFRAFSRALQAARIHGQAIVAYLGPMHRPDLMAEVADLLIRLDSARSALCLGSYEDTLHLSLRTVPLGQDAGLLVQEIVIPPGKAGGHGTMAGGQIPLAGQEAEVLAAQVERHYLAVMGEGSDRIPLLAGL
jgi:nanoRNase/pAp phosphatase (c-di-AMP/oligoRNAs hydrolase)